MVCLTTEQKQDFVNNGYIILRDAIPTSMIDEALHHADTIHLQQDGRFYERDLQHKSITSLYHETDLIHAAEALLGIGDTSLLGKAQIAYTPRDDFSLRGGMLPTTEHPSHKWHVDASRGKFAPLGADFLLLFGIALSSGQDLDENRGQFIYFPGTLNRRTF